MMKQYTVLSGKWETKIEADEKEDMFNVLVKEMRKVTRKDIPLGVIMGVVETGITDEKNIIHYFTLSILESAGFKVNQLNLKRFENYVMKREGINVH